MSAERRYGQWAGNPDGFPENKERCVEVVWRDYKSHQCGRRRGHGPDGQYCKQHSRRHQK